METDSKCLNCIHVAVCGLDTCFEDGCGRYAAKDDLATVVRCKDCKYMECRNRYGGIVCGLNGNSHNENHFCADGEREVENETD